MKPHRFSQNDKGRTAILDKSFSAAKQEAAIVGTSLAAVPGAL